MKHPNDIDKSNILRASIISQEYYRCGENDYTIKCVIKFFNPFIKSQQTVKGTAKCNPDEAMSIKKGKHIAESRAKVLMFKIIQQSIVDVLSATQNKYFNLEVNELKHIKDLINDSV